MRMNFDFSRLGVIAAQVRSYAWFDYNKDVYYVEILLGKGFPRLKRINSYIRIFLIYPRL